MSDKEIEKLIYQLNYQVGSIGKAIFHLKPLSKSVDYGIVWQYNKKLLFNPPLTFYFIKNEEGKYVGGVCDMGFDLHWYILPKYRKKGYLTKNLKEVIINHIFSRNIDDVDLIISISPNATSFYNESVKVALSVGFVKDESENSNSYILVRPIKVKTLEAVNGRFSQERVDVLRLKFETIKRTLMVIQSEIEMNVGRDNQLLIYMENCIEDLESCKNQLWELL